MASIFNEHREILVRCFSFEWKIPDFFPLRDVSYYSPKFNYLGLNRYISLYLSGDYFGIWLHRTKETSSPLWAYFTIGIRKMDGTVYKSFSGKIFANGNHINYGAANFLLKSDLLRDKMEIAPQDVLVVFCNFSLEENVFEKSIATSGSKRKEHVDGKDASTETEEGLFDKTEESTENETLVHPEGIYKLSGDLQNLFLNGTNYDTTVKIGNKEFRVHRAILGARSPVFNKMFTHDTSERNTGNIEIEDCDPEVFGDFLEFLYSGKVEKLSSEKVMGLYGLADKYDVQDVKKEYVNFMAHNLSVDNFCDIATLALQHNEQGLLASATDFFIKNTKKTIMSAKWQLLRKQFPVEVDELYIKAIEYRDEL